MNKIYVIIFPVTLIVGLGNGENDSNKIVNTPSSVIFPSNNTNINEVNVYESFQVCDCDDQCSQRNQCCTEEQYCAEKRAYKEENFICVTTSFDGDIKMIDQCLSNYHERKGMKNIVSKCHTKNKTDLFQDFMLSLPVTTERNVTYRNLFCAVCNNEPKYTLWNVAFSYLKKEKELRKDTTPIADIDPMTILKNVSKQNLELISQVNGTIFKLEIHNHMPSSLTKSVRYCGPNKTANCLNCRQDLVTDRNCSNMNISCENLIPVSLDLAIRHLPKSNLILYEKIWEWHPFDKRSSCWSINASHFDYVDNNTIAFLQNYSRHRRPAWGKTLVKDIIYFCKPNECDENYGIHDVVLTVINILSVIFIILFLATMTNEKDLEKLTTKIMYLTSITLLFVYFADHMPLLKFPCSKFRLIVTLYICLSYYIWLLIASFDTWRVVYLSSKRLRVASNVTHLKRFIIYCSLAWISPLIVISILLHFIDLTLTSTTCESSDCSLTENSFYYLYACPSTAIFCIIVVLFAHTSYYIYFNHGNNSEVQLHYYKIFVKLTLLMGLPFIVVDMLFFLNTESTLFLTIFDCVTGVQGVFIFFVFAYKKSMMDKICGRGNDDVPPEQNNGSITLNTFASSSKRSCSSPEPENGQNDIDIGEEYKKL